MQNHRQPQSCASQAGCLAEHSRIPRSGIQPQSCGGGKCNVGTNHASADADAAVLEDADVAGATFCDSATRSINHSGKIPQICGYIAATNKLVAKLLRPDGLAQGKNESSDDDQEIYGIARIVGQVSFQPLCEIFRFG